MIMCSACCCLRACINAVALVLVSSGQELGTELIKDFLLTNLKLRQVWPLAIFQPS